MLPLDLNIKSTAVTAKPRKLKTTWSAESAQDLRELWGGSPPEPSVVDRLAAVGDPDCPAAERVRKYDEWKAGSDVGLVEAMAEEIKNEIDAEIARSLP